MTESQFKQIRDIVKQLRRLTDTDDWNLIYQEDVALDHDLHSLIVEFAGNKHLKETWEQVNVHGRMARAQHRRVERELILAQEEHEVILETLETRDIMACSRW